MQVSDPNDVKIYNLSAGKSLPEWLSERKRRALVKKDVDIRKRIELLQDFEMPGLSTTVKLSRDGHYVMATGIYKPRVRCFEVDNLAMKFERCFDSEAVTFEILSDDYSKVVFLQDDRWVEFHAGGGRYYRLRIPRYGRDLKHHYATCDLYIVGVGAEIFRLNLERGQFLTPFVSEGSEVWKVAINAEHHLVVVGTREGRVEAWDPRRRGRVAALDCALDSVTRDDSKFDGGGFPSVTALAFDRGLTLGVGTGSGRALLYDLRSARPALVKDHNNCLPVKDLAFHHDYALSMDSNVVKIWAKHTGKMFTYVECGEETLFNGLCHVPNSGLMFMANENTKIQAYYIPRLGPAPRWCSFLDSLTEELEESRSDAIYDDYKFVTTKELAEIGLAHLIGTGMVRGYMHGYFMDARLYRKAKAATEPFAYEEYKRKKIRERIEAERGTRVRLDQALPKVNRELALKLMAQAREPKRKKSSSSDLLSDDRFKALFENPDFQVDTNAEEFRLLNPVLSRLDKGRTRELKKQLLREKFEPVQEEKEDEGGGGGGEEELEGRGSSEEEDSSSEDDREWAEEVKREHRRVKREREAREREEERAQAEAKREERGVRLYELKRGEEFKGVASLAKEAPRHESRLSLGERMAREAQQGEAKAVLSRSRELTFTLAKDKKSEANGEAMKKHREERKRLMRRPPREARVKGGKVKRWN